MKSNVPLVVLSVFLAAVVVLYAYASYRNASNRTVRFTPEVNTGYIPAITTVSQVVVDPREGAVYIHEGHEVVWLGAPIYTTEYRNGLERNIVTEADHNYQIGLRKDGVVVWRKAEGDGSNLR